MPRPRTTTSPKIAALAISASSVLMGSFLVAAAAEDLTLPEAAVLEVGAIALPPSAFDPGLPLSEGDPVKGPLVTEAAGPERAGPDAPLIVVRPMRPRLLVGWDEAQPALYDPLFMDHGAPEVRLRPIGPAY